MPVAKLKALNNTDVMKAEEGNDSLDTFIRQAIGKEPLLSFSRANDSPVQWIQLLHALDQQEFPGWPLLSPLKVQMQKCDKCSKEFCSSINYRRHIRVHHRLKKLDKDSAKNRELLGAFWDKLSEDETKEILSFKDINLEEVPGSSIVKSLTTLLRKPVISPLPQYCLRAASALLDIIQARPSRFPLSSEEFFSILDEASERTFMCGAAVSMQKYVFDGEAGKIGLETKNLVACTSFLLEQKLVKAWLADKDAEALRCQKLLVEEEEAAQRRRAELLERKRQKKLRQKEQKAKEQREEEKADIEERFDGTTEATSLAEQSCPLSTSDSDLHGPNTPPDQQTLQANCHRHIAFPRRHMSPKSQWNHLSNSFHPSQNSHAPKVSTMHKPGSSPRESKFLPMMQGNRKWSRKPKAENVGENSRNGVNREAICQLDDNKKHEVLIGSISVALGNSSEDSDTIDAIRDDFVAENKMPKKSNPLGKHNRSDSGQYGTNRSMVKLWRPVSRNGTKGAMLIENGLRNTQGDSIADKGEDAIMSNNGSLRSCATENNHGGMENNSSVLGDDLCPVSLQFSSEAARAFLAERWKEAIAAEHVKLVLYPNTEEPGCTVVSQVGEDGASEIEKSGSVGSTDNQVVNGGLLLHESKVPVGKAKFKAKPEKGVKLKYIPKQRIIT